MKPQSAFIAILLPLLLVAADKMLPLNAKPGLWEITSAQQMKGALPVPPDVLAKMSPEQRAKIEALFKQREGQGPVTRTRKSCITQEQLSKNPFTEERPSCQRVIVNSTPTLFEFHQECNESNGSHISTDGKFELSGDTNMKGTMKMKSDNSGRTTDISIDMSGKWLSADCAQAKK
jgi:hypothetical protein